jgi:membrane protein YqaA with SNARE-associated domain
MLTLFLSSFLAATFIPFSSEAHLAFLKSQGEALSLLVLVATLGNTLGGMFTYSLGRAGKLEWSMRFLRIKKEQIEKAKMNLNRCGILLAFLCWLPIVGDVFAFVLGISRAPVLLTLIFMTLGKALRYIVVIYFFEELLRIFS